MMDSPLDRVTDPMEARGEKAGAGIVAGAKVTNHFSINGDPEIIQASIKDAMDRYVPEYLQNAYSGGG